jgi:hypothetical protein
MSQLLYWGHLDDDGMMVVMIMVVMVLMMLWLWWWWDIDSVVNDIYIIMNRTGLDWINMYVRYRIG